ncbi:glycosyltransferase family 2 protein [Alicyclobacillus sp. SP_1]|uniref:glycosyltransferase n=1 Tax=Alicyclobacillus sp. SP_1 TaxID=2942475 RepID=UPI002157E73A|nr:glycosyltransferase family 2 protein [Alicyclobacillus sp. SP_1]
MDVSFIIPSFNERENIRPLVDDIHRAMSMASPALDYEIFFVDDSVDNTPDVLAQVSREDERVRFFHREGGKGLASAVVEGFRQTESKYVIVMDADLQHPPALLPSIVERLQRGIDIVIPSRFVSGGSDGGLVGIRKAVSFVARQLGRIALKRLRPISDCTSGYFGLRRSILAETDLQPIGWKILIEILMRAHYTTVHEIPYEFQARDAGESKMSWNEQWNYLRHLFRLMWSSEEDRRFPLFALIGLGGVLVNLLVLSFLVYGLASNHILASIVASVVAMGNNYLWNDTFTWKDVRGQGKHPVLRMALFVLISLVSIVMTTGVMRGLELLHVPIIAGQTVGIVLSTIWSYQANRHWTWGRSPMQRRMLQESKIRVTREANS